MAVKQEVIVIVIIIIHNTVKTLVDTYVSKIFYFIMATAPVAAVFRNKQLTEH